MYTDTSKVHLLTGYRALGDTEDIERAISLLDIDVIQAALSRLPSCRLIVVDPIGSFLGTKTDASKDNEVRGLLAPIARPAERHGAAIL